MVDSKKPVNVGAKASRRRSATVKADADAATERVRQERQPARSAARGSRPQKPAADGTPVQGVARAAEQQKAAAAPDRSEGNVEKSIEQKKIQYSNSTRHDRYPQVFRVVSKVCEAVDLNKPRILSFGCSTGEEVDTLANIYFRDSEILGVDVVESVVEKARDKFGSNRRVRFELSEQEALLKGPPFSVIFAMSVLCHWPKTRKMTDISRLFPFEVFEGHVTLLDQLLAPGGVLVIYNANYSFLHTKTSQSYDLVLYPHIRTNGFVRQFRPDGSFADGPKSTDCIYRKQIGVERVDKSRLRIFDPRMRAIGCIDRGIPAG